MTRSWAICSCATFLIGATCFVLLGGIAFASGSGIGELTKVLTDTGRDARQTMVPAVAIILGTIVLIGVGAGLARVISRST